MSAVEVDDEGACARCKVRGPVALFEASGEEVALCEECTVEILDAFDDDEEDEDDDDEDEDDDDG